MVSIISPTLPTPMEVSSPTLGEFSGVQCGKKATPRAPPQGIPARHFPLALPCCLTPAALLFCPPHLQAAPGLRAATSSQQGGNTGKKQRNKETKKQRNEETKKQRKKERKKERKSLLVGETCSGFLDRTYQDGGLDETTSCGCCTAASQSSTQHFACRLTTRYTGGLAGA